MSLVLLSDHVVVLVARALGLQPVPLIGRVVDPGICALIDHAHVRVYYLDEDEGITWCWWGQERAIDALKAAHALGAPVYQNVWNDNNRKHIEIRSSADAGSVSFRRIR